MEKMKKIILPYALAGTMLLSGCGKQQTNTTTEVPTQATTQAATEALTENEPVVTANNTIYNENIDFCATYGITEEEIETLGKVLNADVNTKQDVTDVCDNLNQILLPQYLTDTLTHIHNEELGYITIEGQFSLVDASSLSQYATNSETKEILDIYESLRARVINDINTTNKVSDETKAALEKAVVDMHEEYIETVEDMNINSNDDGQILFINYIKLKLIDLTVAATNKSKLTSEKYGEFVIAPETFEEAEVNAIVLTDGLDALTDEQKLIYQQYTLKDIRKIYIDGICGAQEKLKEGAKDNTNDYTKEDLMNMKEYLLIQKEAPKYYTLSL